MSSGSTKLKGGSARAVRRYLDDDDKELKDYYDNRKPGSDKPDEKLRETYGPLAEKLGVEKGITDGQFDALFNGSWDSKQVCQWSYRKIQAVDEDGKPLYDNVTGDKIWEKELVLNRDGSIKLKDGEPVLRDKTEQARTGGIDISFAAPKEVSELYARAKTQEQRDAIAQVVKDAGLTAWKQGVQERARVARVTIQKASEVETGSRAASTQGSKTERQVADLMCTPVLQFTSRPTQETEDRGAPGDPHLHLHMMTFTACQVGDTWLTADEYGIKNKANALYRDDIFLGEIARGLEALGFQMDYSDPKASRSGRIVPKPAASKPELSEHWSSNTRRIPGIIKEFEEKHGRPPTDIERRQRTSTTRHRKTDKEMDSAPTVQRWLDDARTAKLDPSEVEPGLPIVRTKAQSLTELRQRLDSSLGFCRTEAAFTGEEIAPAIARLSIGLGLDRDELRNFEAEIRQELVEVRPASKDEFTLFTTKTQLAKEQRVDDIRSGKQHDILPAPAKWQVEKAIANQPLHLEDAQIEGVKLLTSSDGAIVHIDGPAGSGKTSQLKVAKAAHQRAGTVDNIIVVSTAAKAAYEQGRSLGADMYGSVESLETQIAYGNLHPTEKTWWIYDEAAMADTDHMLRFMEMAKHGRITLLGDHHQALPIGAAGWYSKSLENSPRVTLQTVHRHKDHRDVRDYTLLRKGHSLLALQNLHARDRLHMSKDAPHTMFDMMQRIGEARDKGYSSKDVRAVLDGSNHGVDTVNRFMQRECRKRGEIGEESITVKTEDRQWDLHQNDQVIFLKGHMMKVGNRKMNIRNGTSGTIESISGEVVTIQLDNGKVVSLPASEKIGLAYAQHVTKFQGGEVPMVFVLAGEQSTHNTMYSALTRATDEAHLFLAENEKGNAVSKLATQIQEPVEKLSAMSYRERPAQRERDITHDFLDVDDIDVDEIRFEDIQDNIIEFDDIFDDRTRSYDGLSL